MKIVHINTSLKGGAARATIRLHNYMISRGIDSKLVYLIEDDIVVENSFRFSNPKKTIFKRIIIKLLKIFKIGYSQSYKNNNVLNELNKIADFDIFTFPITDFRIQNFDQLKDADIINLHWVADFLDWPTFFKNIKQPIVWTFHDRNPILGGVHLEIDYFRNSDKFKSKDNYYKDLKIKSIKSINKLNIISPSPSLAKVIRSNDVFGKFNIKIIPNAVDSQTFFYIDNTQAKKALGFKPDDLIITFVGSLANHKGLDLLLSSISILNNINVQFLIIGVEKKKTNCIDENILFWGAINNDRLLAIIYAASTGIIITSKEDNLPNVMLESWFCGCPVLSVPIGGMNDSIIKDFNGLISDNNTIESIVKIIKTFVCQNNLFDRKAISEHAKNTYSSEVQLQRYLELYESILIKK